MKQGIQAIGAYLPYHYLTRAALSKAWGGKGGKGEKSVCGADEDSVTMAVEAAMGCFRFIPRDRVDGLYFASTTGPYAEKSHSSLLAVACDLRDDKVFTADVMTTTRAGTSALKLALDGVAAQPVGNILVTAADMRNGYPKSAQETGFGDGAAAVIVGTGEELLAEIDFFTSVNEEINDYWRNAGGSYTLHAEGRFCDTEGYLREMKLVLDKLFKETNSQITDYQKVVLTAQNSKLQGKLAAKFGVTPEQLVDTLLLNVGDTGAAQGLLGVVQALETAKAGDRILVADYGNGANAFTMTVTEQIERLADRSQIGRYLETREELDSYVRFLSWREIASAEPGAPFKLPASTSQTWREQNINLRLHGSVCRKCGAASYPISRVCDVCGSLDEYEEVGYSDQICKLYTYSIDQYAGRSDAPLIIQAIAEAKDGNHLYTVMTDFKKDEIKTGMDVEFTFRKMHNLGDFPNYFWKMRPLRRESV
ncbi:MAG: hypothetical protein HFE83_09395 [Lachnospiraceae bacterium]|nr:hypothetical protein [Lachnospiraceae bacterium]